MTNERVGRGAAFHLGRIALASLFVLGGIDKIANPGRSVAAMADAGLPWPSLLIVAVIAVELGLGLVVAGGSWLTAGRLVAGAALLLVAHTAAVNVLMHPFWTLEGEEALTELSLFFKNVAIMGGLGLVASVYWNRAIRRENSGMASRRSTLGKR